VHIHVGEDPVAIAAVVKGYYSSKIYVANALSNTVSVINGTTDTKETRDIPVGDNPRNTPVDVNGNIYIANSGCGTVSIVVSANILLDS
jgi:YVTN family beta-propeller protein